jgi:eukaryotic-like serine/threonine-protein kinase
VTDAVAYPGSRPRTGAEGDSLDDGWLGPTGAIDGRRDAYPVRGPPSRGAVEAGFMVQKLLQYDVLDRIGEGAKSTIYAVIDPATRKTFALKHVVRKEDKDIRYVEQMEQEFEVGKNLNHPVLRKTYDLKINKTLLLRVTEAFLIMELVTGKTLDQDLPRSLLDILDIFIQVADGIRAMHQAGYVHCDIKPINILRGDHGIKLIDFGQSARVGTVKERIQGTPDYIAPEQVVRRPVMPQTDVFNLGASLYWALTGRTIPTLYTVNKQGDNSLLAHELIQTPLELNPTVPPMLSKLIMECIATSPSKRPANMDEVIQRLELAKHIILKGQGKVPGPEVIAGDEGIGEFAREKIDSDSVEL